MTTDGPSATPPIEVRLTTLRGDRLCITCGFNLHGQTVVREPVYGMVMVRCPECSTPASLQEYPLLGKWPGRFAALLAAVWLLVLLGGLLGSADLVFGMAESTALYGSTKLATAISQKYVEWFPTADEKFKLNYNRWAGGTGPPTVGRYTVIDSGWWDSLDKSSLLPSVGGVRHAVENESVQSLIGTFIACVCVGFVWSVLLLGLRRSRLLVFALLILAMAMAFELLGGSLVDDRNSARWNGGILASNDAAARVLAPYLVAASFVAALVGLSVGLWTGRPLVRWLARLLLPPRLVSALSILWIAEGKPLPRPHSRPQIKAAPKPN